MGGNKAPFFSNTKMTTSSACTNKGEADRKSAVNKKSDFMGCSLEAEGELGVLRGATLLETVAFERMIFWRSMRCKTISWQSVLELKEHGGNWGDFEGIS